MARHAPTFFQDHFFEHLKELFTQPRKKDPDDRKGWYKDQDEGCGNGDPKGLDPWKWDILDVNDGLMELNEEWFGSLGAIERNKEKIVGERKEKEQKEQIEKEKAGKGRKKRRERHGWHLQI